MEISLKNKKVLVTGAGRGIGRDLVRTLVKDGAIVYALTKSEDKLEELKKELPSINPILVDLQDWDATVKALEKVDALDCLVNNAGVAFMESFLEIKKESFDTMNDVNVRAIVNVSQEVVKKMIQEKKSGSIVNVSSVSSTAATKGLLAYGCTKAAVDRLTKGMALELGVHKIRVNSINPTIILTDMGKDLWSDPARANPILSRIPLGRFAETDEAINAILFLLSDKSLMTTGETFLIDGGYMTS